MLSTMKTSKLIKVFRFLIRTSPYLRLVLIQWLYNQYATKNNSGKTNFLNYGYHDDTPLSLNHQDEPNRFFIQLYHRVVQNIDIKGKDIVEVGCGQGAGGVFLLEYKHPRSYIGIDLSQKAIAFCQQHNKFINMQWMQGCADKLPIPDESVDVVINIESSHCYPSMERFIREVLRILRPNGHMAFTDLRHHSQVDALDNCFNTSGLRVLQRSDITPQVLDSLTRLSDRRKAHINATYSRVWRQAVREISSIKGTPTYNGFINGQQKYLCYLLQKK
jgi:ubiquinone/menaquinone biosynthesis C-methylase UbiE